MQRPALPATHVNKPEFFSVDSASFVGETPATQKGK